MFSDDSGDQETRGFTFKMSNRSRLDFRYKEKGGVCLGKISDNIW